MDLLKQEKGSITLFVLIAMLFFVMFLTGMYMLSATAESATVQEQARVKEIYEQGVNNIDDVYATLAKEVIESYTLAETMGGANSPDISGFNVKNTYYVTWETTAPYQPNETTTIDNAPPSGWANYTGKEWANIKTTGGENDCYWVWIPRYAYCIKNGYNSSTAGTIDIKFLKGTTNTPIDESSITISNNSGSGNWNVHPAFWWDKDNDGIEDDGEQLTGIWVAKFEASSSNVRSIKLENGTLTGDTNSLNGNGGGTNTDLKVRVKPNVTSWREITVNNIFTVCQNLTKPGNSLENTKNIDAHMMKNIEWGAVAYLSMSKYGKNSEVWNNPYYNNTTNYSPITGLCSNETNGKDAKVIDITKTCKYNEVGGGNASTTGNVYGVYDMAGGAWEYVAGILSNNKKNGTNTEGNDYYDFSNSNTYPNKYFDWYAGTSSHRDLNYNENTRKYGDAVYETSNSGDSFTDSWESSESFFLSCNGPVLLRGGYAGNGSMAGVFAFLDGKGNTNICGSFRPVVLRSKQ